MCSGRFKFDRRRHEDLIPLSVAASIHEFPQGNPWPQLMVRPLLTVKSFAALMALLTTSAPPLTLTAPPNGPRHKRYRMRASIG